MNFADRYNSRICLVRHADMNEGTTSLGEFENERTFMIYVKHIDYSLPTIAERY